VHGARPRAARSSRGVTRPLRRRLGCRPGPPGPGHDGRVAPVAPARTGRGTPQHIPL